MYFLSIDVGGCLEINKTGSERGWGAACDQLATNQRGVFCCYQHFENY